MTESYSTRGPRRRRDRDAQPDPRAEVICREFLFTGGCSFRDSCPYHHDRGRYAAELRARLAEQEKAEELRLKEEAEKARLALQESRPNIETGGGQSAQGTPAQPGAYSTPGGGEGVGGNPKNAENSQKSAPFVPNSSSFSDFVPSGGVGSGFSSFT